MTIKIYQVISRWGWSDKKNLWRVIEQSNVQLRSQWHCGIHHGKSASQTSQFITFGMAIEIITVSTQT